MLDPRKLGIAAAALGIAGSITCLAWALGPAAPSTTDGTAPGKLLFPLPETQRAGLRDSFHERRGLHDHEAVDIMAPRGTPVYAVEDGRVAKLFRSIPGGKTIYLFDPSEQFAYYYAHLDHYADGLSEGAKVKRGDVIGYVGSTGNAAENAPHLHFAIFKLGPDRRWWKGEPLDPYPYLSKGRG